MGIFVYPSCGSNSIESGDPSGLFPSASDFSQTTIRNAMTGGDMTNFHLFSSTQNGEKFPITFEFINNVISNTFIFQFSSPTFPAPLVCTYNSSDAVGHDSRLQITPDGGNEEIYIESFTLNGVDVGFTPEPSGGLSASENPTKEPTESPTLDGCDFDISGYLETCLC